MRNNNLSVPVLVGTLLLTGVSAVQAAPNTFNTALPVAEGQYLWREQLVLRERSDNGPMDRDVSVQALGSVLGYGVTSKFAVFGVVPYFFNKELDVTTPMGRVERDTNGFGDISLFGRYTFYKKDFTGSTFRVAPVFGLTAPTGDDNDSDRFGELPRRASSTFCWNPVSFIVSATRQAVVPMPIPVVPNGCLHRGCNT